MAKNIKSVRVGNSKSKSASEPQLTNTAVGEFKGHILLDFEPDKPEFGLKMGSKKLQAVLDNLDDVKEFLRVYPYVPKGAARK